MEVGNTVSHKCFLIYMLTDSLSVASPDSRDCHWALEQFSEVMKRLDTCFITSNSYFAVPTDAESFCTEFPKDCVAMLWRGTTTAMKMKAKRSLERMLSDRDTLSTAEGHVVIKKPSFSAGRCGRCSCYATMIEEYL